MNMKNTRFSNFPLGNIVYIVALLMMVLMVGCATKEEAAPAAPSTPTGSDAAADEQPPAAPVEEEAAPVVGGDVLVTSAGFDPDEMTVAVGTTLAVKSLDGRHKLTVDGVTTPFIEEGNAYDITFDEVGTVRVYDILTKKSAIVIVTEEAVVRAGEGDEEATD